MRFRPAFQLGNPDLKRYILLSLPLMVGLTMAFSTEVFFKLFGSFLPAGGIAALNYALRITLMLVAFFGQAVGVAAFPFMARLAAQGNLEEMNQLLNRTLRYLAVVIPFAALLMVLRTEIVQILFQRGRFDLAATRQTADALLFLIPGAVAFAAQTIASRCFYASQNTLTPALYSTTGALLSLPVYWIGMSVAGIRGIALGVAATATIQVLILLRVWNRRSGNSHSGEVLRLYAKMIAVSLAIGAVLEYLRQGLLSLLPAAGIFQTAVVCVWFSLLFTALLFGFSKMLKIAEISTLAQKVAAVARVHQSRNPFAQYQMQSEQNNQGCDGIRDMVRSFFN